MTYRLEVRAEALSDIEVAADWYESREAGFGVAFVEAIIGAIENLITNPLSYRLRDRNRNIRWVLIKRFPYKVVYQIRNERLIVFAVLHASRRDRHWQKRV